MKKFRVVYWFNSSIITEKIIRANSKDEVLNHYGNLIVNIEEIKD